MAEANLYEWTEIISHGSGTMGYDWNTLHDTLVEDKFPPMYESRSLTYRISDVTGNEYGWSEDTCKVVLSFMQEHGVDEITVV